MSDFAPVVWKNADGVEFYIACYWAAHFKQWQDVHKHLVIGCRKAQYDSANPATKQKVKAWIRKALDGEVAVTIQQAEAAADDIGLSSLTIKLWDDPVSELNALGLFAPEMRLP